jgi:hypothetical protein
VTLILTKVGSDGAVMAADSAQTETYQGYTRILDGVSKLVIHSPSSSCIGTWGGAVIPNPTIGLDPIPLQLVIERFVHTENTPDGEEFAHKLAEWLGETFRADKQVIGLDVCSVRPRRDEPAAAVYRLMNADQIDAAPRRFFRVHTLRQPAPYDSAEDVPIIVAGDINAAFWVDEYRAAARNAAERTGRGALPEDVDGLTGWLPSLVRSVGDAYRSLDIGESINTRVSAVTLRVKDGSVKQTGGGFTVPHAR